MAENQQHDGRGVQLQLFEVAPDDLPIAAAPEATIPAAGEGAVAVALQERRTDGESPVLARRPPPDTLRPAIEEYKQYLVSLNRSRHTLDSFGLDLKLLLEHLGDVPLASLGERELRSFISHVRVERKNNAVSVRRKVASLKNFFSYLHRERLIASDPSLRLLYPEIYPALPEFLEEPQVEALLEAAREHVSWEALLALMLETGLKRDEVVALGRTDVHLRGEGVGESYLVVRETERAKRLRSRRLEIGDGVSALIWAYLVQAPAGERFFDLSPRGVNFIVETCGKRARIATRGPRLTPQILRETFAVRHMRGFVDQEDALRRAGMDESTVAALIEAHDVQLLRLLGLHEEPESARKYRKLVRGWTEVSHGIHAD